MRFVEVTGSGKDSMGGNQRGGVPGGRVAEAEPGAWGGTRWGGAPGEEMEAW